MNATGERRPVNRHPLRALAHRLPAYRRRPHGAVQLALCPPPRRQVSCCASRIPTAPARPSRRSPRSSTGWTGSASTGTATAVFQFARAERHAEVARRAARSGPRLSLLRHPRRARGDARRAARSEASRCAMTGAGATAIRRGAGRRALCRPPEGPARGRDRDRRPGPGPGDGRRTRNSTIHHAAALRRHADLYARGRRRRSRHGRHPRDPRRRSPQQRLPPAGDHPRDGEWAGPIRSMPTSR